MRWVALLSLVACTGSDDATDTDTDEVDTDTSDSVTLIGNTFDWGTEAVLAGASICVDGTTTCDTTDDNGGWELDVPADGSELALRIEAEGHVPTLVMYGTADVGRYMRYYVWDEATLATVLGQTGVTWDDATTGILAFETGNPGAGYTSDVSVSLGTAAGDGPFYLGADGIDTSLDATSEAGGGGFVNVPPGEHDVIFTHATLSCAAYSGWGGTAAGSVVARVEAGVKTDLSAVCD